MPQASHPLFPDRRHAGATLADALSAYAGRAVVLGVPRGGVVVADAVAQALDADLDVIVARKIGAPDQSELALGAVAADGTTFINDELIRFLGVPQAWLDRETAAQRRLAEQREVSLRRIQPRVSLEGRVAIVVDDGWATGATVRAAVRSARARHPALVVAAAPVGSVEACSGLRIDADEVVCLYEPADFRAVGLYYLEFLPVSDDDVRSILRSRSYAHA